MEHLLPKPRNTPNNPTDWLETFVSYRKATKGLTPSGEKWLRDTLSHILNKLPVTVPDASRYHLISFLALYQNKPWRRHSFYRAMKTFWKWASLTYDIPNPMLDRWGNSAIEPPKTPKKLLYTQTPETVHILMDSANNNRDKTIIALLADSGARRSELANIQVADVELEKRRIKVMGKGNKEGWLLFGEQTLALLKSYIQESKPSGSLFGVNSEGVKTMLQRLEAKTGLKANTHSFRRGFATELRRQGLSELDIAELGRWSSIEMVRRYSRAYTFDDAAKRYKSIVG